MKIDLMKLSEIKPYDKNPRKNKHAVKKVLASINEFGFRQPIVVDEHNIIVVGHTRYQAAIELGLSEVPVHVATGLSEAQIKAYRIADNRTNEEASWDVDLLKLEVEDLKALDFDIELLGFEPEELDKLNPINIEGLTEDDDAGEASTKTPTSKLGDLFILGNHRLLCGDSTNPDDVKKLMQEDKPNMMVTDPPYGINYCPDWRNDGSIESVGGNRVTGKVQNDLRDDWQDAYSLFTGNIVYIWHGMKQTRTIQNNIIDLGYDLISQIIWNKQHFVLSRGDYHQKHETCLYAVKKGENHNWQGARDQSTVWDIKNNNSFGNKNKEEQTGHGTQKPIECMLRPIVNNSRPGEYVYDPFGGSGTTIIACEKSGRHCLMMELDPVYCDMIVKRWQKFTGQKAIFDTGEYFNDVEELESDPFLK
jgi:DNA modification methylase